MRQSRTVTGQVPCLTGKHTGRSQTVCRTGVQPSAAQQRVKTTPLSGTGPQLQPGPTPRHRQGAVARVIRIQIRKGDPASGLTRPAGQTAAVMRQAEAVPVAGVTLRVEGVHLPGATPRAGGVPPQRVIRRAEAAPAGATRQAGAVLQAGVAPPGAVQAEAAPAGAAARGETISPDGAY